MSNIEQTIGIDLTRSRSITYKAGIYTSLGLIGYFLVMRLFNLHQHVELHYLNIIVLFFGLRYVIKNIILQKGEVRYFEGLKAGLIVTIMAITIFNVFMLVYEVYIDPPFLEMLKKNISIGNVLTMQDAVLNIAGILTIEGLSSGFIMTYMLMQYYKDEKNETS